MKKLRLILFVIVSISCSQKETATTTKSNFGFPIENYLNEINSLSSDSAKQAYWKKLRVLDQDVLLGEYSDSSEILYDSVAIDNMIRATIMLQKHGNSMGINERHIPLLIFIHNNISEASKHYWKNILFLDSLQLIEEIGGGFPSYPIENFASLYRTSFLGQDSIYPYILKKYKERTEEPSPYKLAGIYANYRETLKLKNIDTIGSWKEKPFPNMELESFMMIVKKEDQNYYYENGFYDYKFPKNLTRSNSKFFFEDDVLGWYLQIENDETLSLFDHNGKVKINYPKQNLGK